MCERVHCRFENVGVAPMVMTSTGIDTNRQTRLIFCRAQSSQVVSGFFGAFLVDREYSGAATPDSCS